MAKQKANQQKQSGKKEQQKNNLKNKPKKQLKNQPVNRGNTAIGILVIALLVYICCITNLGGAAFYDNAGFGNLCITVVFILFWSAFPVLYRNNAVLVKVSFVINLIMLIAAANGLVQRLLDSGGFFSAALVSVVAVPFFGLRIVLGWTGTYAVATVITFWWMLYSGTIMRRMQENG